MSETVDKTHEVFRAATLSDDDLGYPDRVAFVPGDQEWADDVVWRNLTEGRATVLVSAENELLLIPQPRNPIDRLRGRVRVNVTQRIHGHAGAYAIAGRLGRHPVRQMRELAHA